MSVSSQESTGFHAPRFMNTLRSKIATVGATAVAMILVYSMATPTAAEADCIMLPTGNELCYPDATNPTLPTSPTTPPAAPAPETPPPDAPATAPATTTPSDPKPPQHHSPAPTNPNHPDHKHHKRHHNGPEVFGPRKRVSYDQCQWGGRICSTGCGDVASADFASDLTGRRITPYDTLRILSPKYYIPGSGTLPEGFKVVARHYGLHEKSGNVASAKQSLRMGGVAVAEFNNAKAIERSGSSSSVAVNDHYVVLDKLRNGKFAMADPHQGSDRHNERTSSGTTRFWTVKDMNREGLINIWVVTP